MAKTGVMKYVAVFTNDDGKTYTHEYEPKYPRHSMLYSVESSELKDIMDQVIYDLNNNMGGSFKLTSLLRTV